MMRIYKPVLSVLTRYTKRLSVKLAPSNECKKPLLEIVTSTFRMSSSGRITARTPSTRAT
jgi:hypothetical protein